MTDETMKVWLEIPDAYPVPLHEFPIEEYDLKRKYVKRIRTEDSRGNSMVCGKTKDKRPSFLPRVLLLPRKVVGKNGVSQLRLEC